MDAIGTVFAATGFLYATFEVLSDATSLLERDLVEFGFLRSLLLHTGFVEARPVIDRVRKYVLPAGIPGAQEAVIIRSSYAESFNMIGVAAAIVASVAITALGLDDIESTHWTTVAAFVISLVAGSLSVYFACLVQLRLGALHRPEDIRAWLTTPRLIEIVDPTTLDGDGKSRHHFILKDRIASFDAALMLVAPAQLLNWSLISLLVGIGIYYGIVFRRKLGNLQGHNANLAVLLVYILFTAGALALFFGPALWKRVECKYLHKKVESIDEQTQARWESGALRKENWIKFKKRHRIKSEKGERWHPFQTRYLQTLVMPGSLALTDPEQGTVQVHDQSQHSETDVSMSEASVQDNVTTSHRGSPPDQEESELVRDEASTQASLLRALQESISAQRNAAFALEQALAALEKAPHGNELAA